jgi:DNA adenine methylase
MKTFIRWQGNKSQHINKFIDYIPQFTGRYIEPFVGSGALFLKLQPKKWIINDINKDLILIWKSVKNKNDLDHLIKKFKAFQKKFVPMSKEEKMRYCKEITSKIEKHPMDVKRAINYLLMKHSCYMNNIVINNKFVFNGLDLHILSRNKYYFLEEKYYDNLFDISQFLNESRGKIYNKSYEKIIDKAKKGDFVFLDPPYIQDHNYGFNYNKHETLDDNFINKLYSQVRKLDKKGVKWLMTQADTKEIRTIFKDYMIKEFKVYRMGMKKYVNELVIANYKLSI